jgi:hypothetical protein
MVLLAGAVVLLALLVDYIPHTPKPSPLLPDRIEVVRLDVEHTPKVIDPDDRSATKLLGRGRSRTHLHDRVKVRARLSQPGYAFLLVFGPNGQAQPCFPQEKGEPPPLTDEPRYPLKGQSWHWELEEGTGLEVIALVVSSRLLPSFNHWWPQCQGCPWKKEETTPGKLWWANGEDEVDLASARDELGPHPNEVKGDKAVEQLAAWLRKCPQIETVQVLGFAVLPEEKR